MKYDVYLYEDCRVLKNKLNLKDEAELDKAESEFASIWKRFCLTLFQPNRLKIRMRLKLHPKKKLQSIKSTIQTIITRRLTNMSRENRAYSLITASQILTGLYFYLADLSHHS